MLIYDCGNISRFFAVVVNTHSFIHIFFHCKISQGTIKKDLQQNEMSSGCLFSPSKNFRINIIVFTSFNVGMCVAENEEEK